MKSNKDIVAGLIKEYKGDDLAGYIAKNLEMIETVKDNTMKIYRAREETKVTYNRQLAAILKDEKAIQSRCRHLDITYHGDPAGGSDSHTRCNHCQAVLEDL